MDAVRRELWRQLTAKQRVSFKGTRWLLLKNPWNLTGDQKERLSTLVRWNAPIIRAYYLKEAFQLFWGYKQPKRAKDHLEKWMRSAMRSATSRICVVMMTVPPARTRSRSTFLTWRAVPASSPTNVSSTVPW